MRVPAPALRRTLPLLHLADPLAQNQPERLQGGAPRPLRYPKRRRSRPPVATPPPMSAALRLPEWWPRRSDGRARGCRPRRRPGPLSRQRRSRCSGLARYTSIIAINPAIKRITASARARATRAIAALLSARSSSVSRRASPRFREHPAGREGCCRQHQRREPSAHPGVQRDPQHVGHDGQQRRVLAGGTVGVPAQAQQRQCSRPSKPPKEPWVFSYSSRRGARQRRAISLIVSVNQEPRQATA